MPTCQGECTTIGTCVVFGTVTVIVPVYVYTCICLLQLSSTHTYLCVRWQQYELQPGGEVARVAPLWKLKQRSGPQNALQPLYAQQEVYLNRIAFLRRREWPLDPMNSILEYIADGVKKWRTSAEVERRRSSQPSMRISPRRKPRVCALSSGAEINLKSESSAGAMLRTRNIEKHREG